MFALGLALALLPPSGLLDDDITVDSTPPIIVKTIPEAGAKDVDPNLTQIRVTFSEDMLDGSWSWSQISEETLPKTSGKPHYLKDKRRCVLSVKLEPGKTYAIWVNSDKFDGFKDADWHAAVPYLLLFQTKK